ncbi:hypothetical protein [Nonlabens sp. SY33080]|uniref:hypothetical protein n=1 Tax=Nonlabens sp. SY33080 TaxID=2719911 RepID=UPI001428CFE4|nr:hypothetical protein [Nonlabens sp. SY33080]
MIKFKHVIIAAVIAVLLFLIGSTFKILHWAFPFGEGRYFGGAELIMISTSLWVMAGILLIIKAVKAKGDHFLNR